MYVMTPFTSLLVLENEDMYTQYKVDRGRKDHWAMYPCPEKIPVVYEPLDGMPADPKKKGKAKAKEVAATVLGGQLARRPSPWRGMSRYTTRLERFNRTLTSSHANSKHCCEPSDSRLPQLRASGYLPAGVASRMRPRINDGLSLRWMVVSHVWS